MPTEKNIKTPEELYIHFESYKTEAKNNPYLKHVFVGKDGNSKYQELEKPLTWDGFEIWLRKNEIISRLDHYKANLDGRYAEYVYIIRAIDREIYNDKYSGAAVGVYHNNIIARDLGLAEKVDNKHDFSGGNVTFKVEGEEPEEQ
jgi:hypothetical protein